MSVYSHCTQPVMSRHLQNLVLQIISCENFHDHSENDSKHNRDTNIISLQEKSLSFAFQQFQANLESNVIGTFSRDFYSAPNAQGKAFECRNWSKTSLFASVISSTVLL